MEIGVVRETVLKTWDFCVSLSLIMREQSDRMRKLWSFENAPMTFEGKA